MKPKKHSQILTTDASMSGWGAHLGQMQVAGTWSENLQKQHINYLEMMAVFLGLKHFVKHLENKVVLVKTDNTTVMCYINKQGGTRSPSLCILTWNMFQWAIKHKIVLIAQHVSGRNNCLADLLSRGVQNKEHGVDFEKVCGPNIFSDVGNSTCRPICHSTESPDSNICIPISRRISPDSRCSVDQLEGCDRLCIPSHCSNSQSPAENSGRGLQDNSHCTILDKTTLVLTQLLVDYPVRLPEISDLISQPRSRLYHQNVSMLKLTAWRLSADSWL